MTDERQANWQWYGKRKDPGRTVDVIERWVRRGVAERWCVQVPSHDREHGFRRKFMARIAGNCEEPYTVEVWGRYDRKGKQVTPIFVDVETRCRKCQSCLDWKSVVWGARALDEYSQSQGTYHLALTIAPEAHYAYDCRMQTPLYKGKKLVRDAVGPLHGLAPATLFRLRAREIGYDITDMLKRMRKKADFRYLLVAERHDGTPGSEVHGRPHFHLLLHQKKGKPLALPTEIQQFAGPCEAGCKHKSGRPLIHKHAGELHDHAALRKVWPHGFTKARLCMDAGGATYVCKYVSKDPMTRIRASIGYGRLDDGKSSTQPTHRDGLVCETQSPSAVVAVLRPMDGAKAEGIDPLKEGEATPATTTVDTKLDWRGRSPRGSAKGGLGGKRSPPNVRLVGHSNALTSMDCTCPGGATQPERSEGYSNRGPPVEVD